jgi:hypothetical protein
MTTPLDSLSIEINKRRRPSIDYQLPIEIEHVSLNCPVLDYRKEEVEKRVAGSTYYSLRGKL